MRFIQYEGFRQRKAVICIWEGNNKRKKWLLDF